MIAEVRCAAPLSGDITSTPSKNYTTRYLLASALADGESEVLRPAVQDDSVALVQCLRRLGAEITPLDSAGREVAFTIGNEVATAKVRGFGAHPHLRGEGPIDPENAGAVLRMLMGVCALLPEVTFDTNHRDSLGKRPNADLLAAFAQLGVETECAKEDGSLPVTIRGGIARISAHLAKRRSAEDIAPGQPITITVSGAVSSQFCSALMFLAPLLDEDIAIEVTGRIRSRPLLATTSGVLARAGVRVESTAGDRRHIIKRGQHYRARSWNTNGDWPGSSALLAAAAVVPNSKIRLRGLCNDDQGERRCVDFFRACGHTIDWNPDAGEGADLDFITAPAPNAAIIDGDLCTDAVLAMMGAATICAGKSQFSGVRNLQFKECDRVREPIDQLRAIYATTPGLDADRLVRFEPEADPDLITIVGNPTGFIGGIEVDGRGDHRVIMMLSIVALRCRDGLRIRGAEHVTKSYPDWFRHLRELGADIRLHGAENER